MDILKLAVDSRSEDGRVYLVIGDEDDGVRIGEIYGYKGMSAKEVALELIKPIAMLFSGVSEE